MVILKEFQIKPINRGNLNLVKLSASCGILIRRLFELGNFQVRIFIPKLGLFSAGFGYDNQAISDYSFAVGKSNIIAINAISSTITGGESNEVYKPYSGILSGQDNKIEDEGAGFSVISGGYANDIRSNYGFIGSGQNNTIEANSNFSSINGGDGNTIVGHKSSILWGRKI